MGNVIHWPGAAFREHVADPRGSLRVIAAGAAADRRAFAEHPHGAVRVGQKADAEVTVQSGARGHVITKSCEVLFSQPFSIRKRRRI